VWAGVRGEVGWVEPGTHAVRAGRSGVRAGNPFVE